MPKTEEIFTIENRMEPWERVQKVIDHFDHNMNSFSHAIGMTNNVTITRIIKEKRRPSNSTLQKISSHLPVSLEWLKNETGPMIINEPEKRAEAFPVDHKQLNIILVPFVNQHAYAGYLSGFGDEEYLEELPKEPWVVDRQAKGNYRTFEVRGDSMDNGTDKSILSGDRLLCRQVSRDYWKYKLHIHKWNFVIVHREMGIIVKKITQHDVEKGILTCHSLNEDYEDFKIELNGVAEIYNIITIKREMRG